MKTLLVLDLDETLIYSSEFDLEEEINPSYYCKIFNFFLYKRPYLDEFLDIMSKYFDLAIWTSAGEDYAKLIVDKVIKKDIKFLYTSKHCTIRYDREKHENYNVKKLSKLSNKGFNINNILIVDDSPEKAMENYGNYVPILPFYGDHDDNQLKLLSEYLIQFSNSDNIRSIEKRVWNKKNIY